MNPRTKGEVDPAVATAIQKMVDDAFANGFFQGLLTARNTIETLFASSATNAPSDEAERASGMSRRNERAAENLPLKTRRRGVAAAAITSVFERERGLSVSAIHRKATGLGHELSLEAIGAELRRHEGNKYHRSEGRFWFPFGSPEENETDRHARATANPSHTEHQSSADPKSDAPFDQAARHAA